MEHGPNISSGMDLDALNDKASSAYKSKVAVRRLPMPTSNKGIFKLSKPIDDTPKILGTKDDVWGAMKRKSRRSIVN